MSICAGNITETTPPKIQNPAERDRSDDRKLPSNPGEVEALRRGASSAARNPLVAFSFAELRKVANDFRNDALIGGGGFGRVYKGSFSPAAAGDTLAVAVKVHDGDNSFQGHREWLVRIRTGSQLFSPLL